MIPIRNRIGLWCIVPTPLAESMRYMELYEQRNGQIVTQNVLKKHIPLSHFCPVRRYILILKEG